MEKKKKPDYRDVKGSVEELYVHEGKSIEYIAKIYNIPSRTIYGWRKAGNWDKLKNELKQSSWKTVVELKTILPDLMERVKKEPDAKNIDALIKAISAIKKLEKDVDIIGNALHIIRELALFLKPIDSKATEILSDHIGPFIAHLQAKYNL